MGFKEILPENDRGSVLGVNHQPEGSPRVDPGGVGGQPGQGEGEGDEAGQGAKASDAGQAGAEEGEMGQNAAVGVVQPEIVGVLVDDKNFGGDLQGQGPLPSGHDAFAGAQDADESVVAGGGGGGEGVGGGTGGGGAGGGGGGG